MPTREIKKVSDNKTTKCQKRVLIREGSFWERKKLSFSIDLEFLFLFAHNVCSGQAIKMLAGEAGSNSIYTWENFNGDIMSRTLLEALIWLGGPNTIVEIDESKWGNKRKYNRGTNKCKHTYIYLNSVTAYSCPREKSKGKLQLEFYFRLTNVNKIFHIYLN